MKYRLTHFNIQRKLTVIVLATVTVVLLVMACLLLPYELLACRRSMVQDVGALADVVGANSTAALAFQNERDAQEVLASLRVEPHIRVAALYAPDGRLFAQYPETASRTAFPAMPQAPGFHFTPGRFVFFRTIAQGPNRPLGMLLLESDLGKIYDRFGLYAAVMLVVFAVGVGVAYLTIAKLQHQISGPILELSQTARLVSGDYDYTVRAEKRVGGEIGQLTDALNHMLTQIGEQNRLLALSERRHRALFQGSPLPMWVYDLATLRFLMVNDAACAHYGYSREEFLAMTIEQIRPAEDLPALRTSVKNTPMGIERATRVWRHLKKDGTMIQVEITSHDLALDGRTGRMVLANDVTSRIRAEESLRASEERHRAVLHAAPVALGYTRTDGCIIDANPELCSFLGYASGEMIGRTLAELGAWSSPEDEGAVFGPAAKEGGIRNRELKFLRKDRAPRVGLLSAEPLVLADAPLILLMIVDVTEQKTLESELRRMQRVESVGRLAGGIAHDMNNVLSPIMMAVPLLRTGLAPADEERMLKAIEASAHRGAALVRQLLVFGRGMDGEYRPIALSELLGEIEEIARETFPKNISISVSPAKVWQVWGDPSQLHQIILNLWVNARDAMPAGGTLETTLANVEIDADTAAQWPGASAGRYVRLCIADTGTGIPPEIKDRIFDPFFTTKEIGKGTGLGLATVLTVAKRHGGFLRVFSEVGRGTRFEVYLLASGGSASLLPERAPVRVPLGHGETILVVDDEEHIRAVVRDALALHSYRVITASNGAEANDLIARHREVALVITDLDMPLMDGMSLTRVLRGTRPQVPVVISTGISDRPGNENRIAKLEEMGIAGVLLKPFTTDQILTTIHRALVRPSA